MTFRRISAADVSFPVVFLTDTGIRVWQDARRLVARPRDGLLIDREGRSYQVVRTEDPFVRDDGRWGVTLVCDGEPSTLTVEEVCQKLTATAWRVSALGHFESPEGFGIPRWSSSVGSVAELLDSLIAGGARE